MIKNIMRRTLLASSILSCNGAFASNVSDANHETQELNRKSITVADVPAEEGRFIQFIGTLEGQPIATINLKNWKGLTMDDTLYGVAVLIQNGNYDINEIILSWGHMAMTHPLFKKKDPKQMEDALYQTSGNKTRFTLSF